MIGELVEHLARGVVQNPDQVTVAEQSGDGRVALAVEVAYEDFGRIIGRSGQTIAAIRTLAAFAGRRQGLDVNVEVVERRRSGRGPEDE